MNSARMGMKLKGCSLVWLVITISLLCSMFNDFSFAAPVLTDPSKPADEVVANVTDKDALVSFYREVSILFWIAGIMTRIPCQ